MAETSRGFLVLADITGYTAFVTATELEHGPPIVAALLEEVIRRIAPPLDVLGIEGRREDQKIRRTKHVFRESLPNRSSQTPRSGALESPEQAGPPLLP